MNTLLLLLKGTVLTIEISTCSLLIGSVFGIFFGVLSCKRVPAQVLKPFIKSYVSLIRGTPIFIQLLLIYFALPIAFNVNLPPLAAGIITLGINSTAYIAEIVRSGMNDIPLGQWEAGAALGYSQKQIITSIILPQALRKALPALMNELTALIKESSLLMILGIAELTKVSKEIVARELNPLQTYLVTALLYFLLTSITTRIAKKWEGGVHDTH